MKDEPKRTTDTPELRNVAMSRALSRSHAGRGTDLRRDVCSIGCTGSKDEMILVIRVRELYRYTRGKVS